MSKYTFLGRRIYRHKTESGSFSGYRAKVLRPSDFNQWHYAETLDKIKDLMADETEMELNQFRLVRRYDKELEELINI